MSECVCVPVHACIVCLCVHVYVLVYIVCIHVYVFALDLNAFMNDII